MNVQTSLHKDERHALNLFIDEEIGGKLGMAKFVQHEEFKKLNVGFALDEGKYTCRRTIPFYTRTSTKIVVTLVVF